MSIGKIKYLYCEKGLSAREVGERLNKTTWQIIRTMKKYNITRRTSAETQKIQFRNKPLSYNKKRARTSSEQSLYEAGLMLYWAEGVKAGKKDTVDFANSDKKMVSIFLSMLRHIYRVDEKRLRILLYCYANQDSNKLIKYWSTILQIPTSQFFKPYIRQDFNENKTHKMPHGLVHIRYSDMKLFEQILKDIDIISRKLKRNN
jgi:hypothetical protein